MIEVTTTEVEQVRTRLSAMEQDAQEKFTVLDEYKTYLCCLDKPEIVRLARSLGGRNYSSSTRNYVMIAHLMTARRRELGYEDLLDAIDALKSRLATVQEG